MWSHASDVLYVGVAPGQAGVYQLNIRVPQRPAGKHAIALQIDGFNSPTVGYLAIGQ
jgi:uncharacterized protein (TIGR03437 family)